MPGSALPDESVLLGTVGTKGIPADVVTAAGSAEGVAIELTGDGLGTTAATVRLGDSLERVMPTTAMMHRVARVQGSTLCGVGLAAFLRLLAFRIKILRETIADRLRNQSVIAERSGYREAWKFYRRNGGQWFRQRDVVSRYKFERKPANFQPTVNLIILRVLTYNSLSVRFLRVGDDS